MRSDRRRKFPDRKAVDVKRYTLISGRRYRVLLVLDPKLPKRDVLRSFSRWLTRIVDDYNSIWPDYIGVTALKVNELRQSRKKRERTPAHIASVTGLSVPQVERMIYGKTAK
jgi:hypothetical protein